MELRERIGNASLTQLTPTMLAGSGRWGALRSKIKGEANGRRTFAEQSAPPAWSRPHSPTDLNPSTRNSIRRNDGRHLLVRRIYATRSSISTAKKPKAAISVHLRTSKPMRL